MSIRRPPDSGTNGLAIASLVLGILWMGGAASVAAVITGVVARRQLSRTGQRGDGLAIAGIVLGVIGGLPLVAVLVLYGAGRFAAAIT